MVRKPRQLVLSATALVAVTALAAGCSSGGGESSATESAAPTQTSAPAADGVPASIVGMHVEGEEAGNWPSAPFGALRLWDNGTGWSQIELEPGVYKWDNLEGALENAASKGMTDVLMVLGTTPEWNATTVGLDDYPQPGAASPPKDLKAWDAWVTEVATRYKGRISAYQIWNEANLKTFWNGTPEELAELTKRAYDIIKAIDPEALVVSASPTTRLTSSFDKFFPAYLTALGEQGWPVDVIAIHTYPAGDGDPADRGAAIQAARDYLTAAGAPDLPLWDTELNYGIAGPGDISGQDITGPRAAGFVVRTYIDDLRYDVGRSYWYIWTQRAGGNTGAVRGIQAFPGSDAEQGFFALENWVIGASFDGCTDDAAGAVTCTFSKDGTSWVVAWAEKGDTTYTVPEGARLVCDPLANCQEVESGASITVTEVPVRFYFQ